MTETLDAPHQDDLAALAIVERRYAAPPSDPRLAWRRQARPDQLLPPVDGTWRTLLLTGGRGSGKTRSGAQDLSELILADTSGAGEYGIIAPTYADAWTKCVEGESGLLRALGTSMKEVKNGTSKTVRNAWRTYGQVILHSGIVVYIDSAAEGGLRIQGRNLKAAWCDEIGLWDKWDTTWNESLRYAVRMGSSVIIATATPKVSRPAAALFRSLLRNAPEHGGVIVRRLRTIDNRENLSEAFYKAVIGASKGTRLERQELEGELLDDVPNALWTRELLEAIQVPAIGGPDHGSYLRSAVIGVDPSDGAESSDEQAYTLAGLGFGEDIVYVAENWGGQESPPKFARRVLLKAIEWEASIAVERNHGGQWMISMFQQVIKELQAECRLCGREQNLHHDGYECPFKPVMPPGKVPAINEVWASQAKRTRAEPVSALYQRDKVRHCKMNRRDSQGELNVEGMVELEDQMATYTGGKKERSPDRMDSLVWALQKFLYLSAIPDEKSRPQPWGVEKDSPLLDAAGGTIGFDPAERTREAALERRMVNVHGGLYSAATGNWDTDGFAPQDADPEPGSENRAAVHSYR